MSKVREMSESGGKNYRCEMLQVYSFTLFNLSVC